MARFDSKGVNGIVMSHHFLATLGVVSKGCPAKNMSIPLIDR